MFIISKALKDKEFIYSNKYSILCKNEQEANALAGFMNNHNDTALNDFKLNNNEVWHVFKIDEYDAQPRYKLKQVKGKISIVEL